MTRTFPRPVALLALALALLGALAPWPASAAPLEAPASGEDIREPAASADVPADVLDSLLNRVDARWMRRRALAARGDREGAAEAARDLASLLRDENIARVASVAEAAVLDGQREARAGNHAVAAEAFQLARTLDPGQATAWWGEGIARFRSGQGVSASLPPLVHAVGARWGSGWLRLGAYVEVVALGLAALLLAGAAGIVVLLIVHGPVLAHGLEERLPTGWHAAWRRAIAWTLLLAPAAVQLLGAFALMVWAVVLVPAATRAERRLIYAWLVLATIAVPLVGSLGALSGVSVSPSATVAALSAQRALAPDLLADLEAMAATHPGDATWKVLMARYLAPRHPDRALRLLREASAVAPGDVRIKVALGNLLFRSGKREAAAALYREAAEQDPKNVLALFDWARAKGALFDSAGEAGLLRRAAAIAPGAVRELERTTAGAEVADPVIGVDEIMRHVLQAEAWPAVRSAMAPSNPVTLAGLAALLAALVMRMRVGAYAARRCERCGRAYCPRCGGEEKGSETCTPCVQLFGRREGLAPAARQAQARRVDRWLKTVSRGRAALHALWPGLGHLHGGRTATGFAQAALWVLLLAGAFAPQRLLPPVADLRPWGTAPLFAIGAALLWAIVQLPRFRPATTGRRGER